MAQATTIETVTITRPLKVIIVHQNAQVIDVEHFNVKNVKISTKILSKTFDKTVKIYREKKSPKFQRFFSVSC